MYKSLKLKKFYKIPFISIFLILFIVSYLIFLEFKDTSLKRQEKFLKLKIYVLNSSLKDKKEKIKYLKRKYNNLRENLKKNINTYSLKKAFKLLFSDKSILILNYKYKFLKSNSLYKVVKLKLTFLTNYENLKNYLYNLQKLGFKILELNLKSHKYPIKTNYTILANVKLAFYLPPKELVNDNKKRL